MDNEEPNYPMKFTDFIPFVSCYRDRIQPGWRDMSRRECRDGYLKLNPKLRVLDIISGLGGRTIIPTSLISPLIYYFAEEIGRKMFEFNIGLESFLERIY